MKQTLIAFRTPLIRFLGKRKDIGHVDHTPKPHPQSPTHSLPDSFLAAYKQTSSPAFAFSSSSFAGKKPSSPVAAGPGQLFSVTELPARFKFRPISELEIENINNGGSEIVFP